MEFMKLPAIRDTNLSKRQVAVKRRRSVKWIIIFSVVLGLSVLLLVSDSARFLASSVLQMVIYGNPAQSDRRELEALIEAVITVHHFSHSSVAQPGRDPVFGSPGSKALLTRPTTIQVYAVQDRADQDQIIEAVGSLVARQKFRPVDLSFIQHENWMVTGRVGRQGSEIQLRRVRIASGGVEEKEGQKAITYRHP
jgi:hypothetical protein